MLNIRKVVVGISGGVDSAVSALLLKKKGFDVLGVFMRNWDVPEETGFCATAKDFEDATYVCKTLNIPLREVDFVKEYWNDVFLYMVQSYEKGLTPNPDVVCNKRIKFDLFYKYAMDVLKADAIATGHYARTTFGPYLENYNPSTDVRLLRPLDSRKDQTLFLSQIPQHALRKTMFPLGDHLKQWTKKVALEIGLERITNKRESMGLCFIGKRNFQKFISGYIKPKPGRFIHLLSGKVLGESEGQHMWTIGQRTGHPGYKECVYVAEKDPETNDIFVVDGNKHPSLFTHIVYLDKPYWIAPAPYDFRYPFSCTFRFQNLDPPIPCDVMSRPDGQLIVILSRPLRSITAGQYVALYNGEECLGGSTIIRPGPSWYSLGLSLPENYSEFEDEKLDWSDVLEKSSLAS